MRRGWQVDHSCPQCGGPVTLEESDHLLVCPFCRVTFYLVSRDAHRYYLPPKEPVKEDLLVYVPYWRFKGVVYSCISFKVTDQILDASLRAVEVPVLPASLGLRPQAMKLKFMRPDLPGLFVEPRIGFEEALGQMEERRKVLGKAGQVERPWHSTYFGESISLIYAPFYHQDDRVLDAVINTYLGKWPPQARTSRHPADEVNWEVRFIPAICPHCGWDMQGDSRSLLLVCRNCGTASASDPSGLKQKQYVIMPGGRPDSFYLPFWRIKPEVSGIKLDSYADLIRVTNQPRAVLPEMENKDLFFFTPAFKVHAQMFLRLARNTTISQPALPEAEEKPPLNLIPVTLSLADAEASLKTALAVMSLAKRNLFPELPGISLKIRTSLLVFFPFYVLGQDLVNDELQISVNKVLVGL